jgi:hypothetical protein
MCRLLRIAPAALLLFTSALLTTAQTSEPKTAAPEAKTAAPAKAASSKTAATSDAEQQLRTRRSQARSLLIALSTDARTFHDQRLRARSLARIADALWQIDTDQGRLLFRKAWEAAEVADQESDRQLQEEIQQQKTKTGGGFAVSLPPNLRREVLRLAARHDRVLSEEFLEKLKTQKADAANATNLRPGRLNETLSQRLGVARELLQAGDMEKALQFAEPALAVVGVDSINFLCDLRDKDAVAADRRYAALLSSSATNPQSDANTVSLLSSYIFTPRLYVIFTDKGANTSQMSQKITPAEVSPELRPLPQPGQEQQGTAGTEGKFLVVKRLLPFFEQYASPDIVESLRAQLNALNGVVSDDTRKRDDEWVNRGVRPEKPAEDREQALLDRVDRAKTSAEREGLYIQLAQMAANRGEMKARDYAGKIEDSEIRKQVQSYIDGSLAIFFVNKKLTDPALELVQKGDLTHLQKVWVLTQCAKILAPNDKDKATELLESAATEARRIDVSDPALPQALIAVADAFKVVDPPRVWDATFEAVRAANSAQGFTGEDALMTLKFQSKNGSSVHTNDVAEFNLEGIFKDLSDQDYERAVELARGFEAEGPRAVATIAIARAVLDPKKRATVKN